MLFFSTMFLTLFGGDSLVISGTCCCDDWFSNCNSFICRWPFSVPENRSDDHNNKIMIAFREKQR